jgi:hypothetical protein
MADPEAGVAMAAQQVATAHAGSILMLPLIGFAILLIIIGIIVLSAAKNKTPGYLLTFLGLMVGGGAFFVAARSEGQKH